MLCKILIPILFVFNLLLSQNNYLDFFLLNYQPEEGHFIFQDLDSSPLCDAIEEVTPGIFNQNYSHVGMVIKRNKNYEVLEAYVNGVKTVTLEEFINRSSTKSGIPKITIAKIHPYYLNENTDLIQRAIEKSKNYLNKKYDINFLMDNDSYYCSEFIYEIFNGDTCFFNLSPMTYKKSNGKFHEIWIEYFNELKMDIPEGKPGINPGKMTLNKNLKFIFNYKKPYDFN